MPSIGQSRKRYRENRPHSKHYFTPPSKSRRCNRVTSPRMILMDKSNTPGEQGTTSSKCNRKELLELIVELVDANADAPTWSSTFMEALKMARASEVSK